MIKKINRVLALLNKNENIHYYIEWKEVRTINSDGENEIACSVNQEWLTRLIDVLLREFSQPA